MVGVHKLRSSPCQRPGSRAVTRADAPARADPGGDLGRDQPPRPVGHRAAAGGETTRSAGSTVPSSSTTASSVRRLTPRPLSRRISPEARSSEGTDIDVVARRPAGIHHADAGLVLTGTARCRPVPVANVPYRSSEGSPSQSSYLLRASAHAYRRVITALSAFPFVTRGPATSSRAGPRRLGRPRPRWCLHAPRRSAGRWRARGRSRRCGGSASARPGSTG